MRIVQHNHLANNSRNRHDVDNDDVFQVRHLHVGGTGRCLQLRDVAGVQGPRPRARRRPHPRTGPGRERDHPADVGNDRGREVLRPQSRLGLEPNHRHRQQRPRHPRPDGAGRRPLSIPRRRRKRRAAATRRSGASMVGRPRPCSPAAAPGANSEIITRSVRPPLDARRAPVPRAGDVRHLPPRGEGAVGRGVRDVHKCRRAGAGGRPRPRGGGRWAWSSASPGCCRA